MVKIHLPRMVSVTAIFARNALKRVNQLLEFTLPSLFPGYILLLVSVIVRKDEFALALLAIVPPTNLRTQFAFWTLHKLTIPVCNASGPERT
jgi:hypothetical protein